MNYLNKVLIILKNTHDLNEQILQTQDMESLADHNFANLYEAYSISNHKLKNAIDLLELIND